VRTFVPAFFAEASISASAHRASRLARVASGHVTAALALRALEDAPPAGAGDGQAVERWYDEGGNTQTRVARRG